MNQFSHNEIQNHLPLREATFFILLSMTPGARHGYAILQEVQRLSEGRVVLSTGTLYGALKRLLEQDWIERIDTTDPGEDENTRSGPPRKTYMLTDLGRQILRAEEKRLEDLLTALRAQTAKGH